MGRAITLWGTTTKHEALALAANIRDYGTPFPDDRLSHGTTHGVTVLERIIPECDFAMTLWDGSKPMVDGGVREALDALEHVGFGSEPFADGVVRLVPDADAMRREAERRAGSLGRVAGIMRSGGNPAPGFRGWYGADADWLFDMVHPAGASRLTVVQAFDDGSAAVDYSMVVPSGVVGASGLYVLTGGCGVTHC